MVYITTYTHCYAWGINHAHQSFHWKWSQTICMYSTCMHGCTCKCACMCVLFMYLLCVYLYIIIIMMLVNYSMAKCNQFNQYWWKLLYNFSIWTAAKHFRKAWRAVYYIYSYIYHTQWKQYYNMVHTQFLY